MKKGITLFLTLSMCLALCACGQAAEAEAARTEVAAAENLPAGTYTFGFSGQMGDEIFTLTLNEDGTCHLELNPMLGPWDGAYTAEGSHISVASFESSNGTPALWPEYFNVETGACELDLKDDGSFTFVEQETGSDDHSMMGGMPGGMMGNMPSGVQVEKKEGYLTWENESYGAADTQTFSAMVEDDGEEHPALVVVPGGAFRFVDGGHFSDICNTLCEQGWLVVQLSYTTGAGTYPQAIIDVKTALQYVFDHAGDLHADTEKLCVMGSSAGGYLASYAVLGSPDTFKTADSDPDYSYSVYGLIDFFGATQWMTDALFADIGPDAAESEWLGKDVSAMDKADRDAIDPLNELDTADVTKVWVSHGSADTTMPILNSQQFYDGVTSVLGEDNTHFEILEGAVHEDDAFYTAENLTQVSEFLN